MQRSTPSPSAPKTQPNNNPPLTNQLSNSNKSQSEKPKPYSFTFTPFSRFRLSFPNQLTVTTGRVRLLTRTVTSKVSDSTSIPYKDRLVEYEVLKPSKHFTLNTPTIICLKEGRLRLWAPKSPVRRRDYTGPVSIFVKEPDTTCETLGDSTRFSLTKPSGVSLKDKTTIVKREYRELQSGTSIPINTSVAEFESSDASTIAVANPVLLCREEEQPFSQVGSDMLKTILLKLGPESLHVLPYVCKSWRDQIYKQNPTNALNPFKVTPVLDFAFLANMRLNQVLRCIKANRLLEAFKLHQSFEKYASHKPNQEAQALLAQSLPIYEKLTDAIFVNHYNHVFALIPKDQHKLCMKALHKIVENRNKDSILEYLGMSSFFHIRSHLFLIFMNILESQDNKTPFIFKAIVIAKCFKIAGKQFTKKACKIFFDNYAARLGTVRRDRDFIRALHIAPQAFANALKTFYIIADDYQARLALPILLTAVEFNTAMPSDLFIYNQLKDFYRKLSNTENHCLNEIKSILRDEDPGVFENQIRSRLPSMLNDFFPRLGKDKELLELLKSPNPRRTP